MEFDFGLFYDQLQIEVRASKDFARSMKTMIAACAKQLPHDTWTALAAIDVAKEPKAVKRWIPRVLEREPCTFPVRGAYFGLSEYAASGAEYANLYFALMGAYDANDKKSEWLWENPRHYPDKAHLHSKALKQGGIMCAGDGNIGTPGLIGFSVSFSALLLRHALDADIFALFRGSAPIGVVTGYDSGDLLNIGEITSEGFAPNKRKFA